MENNIEIELANKLNKQNQKENYIASPLGIEMIIALWSNGAEGETQSEMLQLLNYKTVEEANKKSREILDQFNKNKDIIKIANAILTKTKSTEKFIKTGNDEYDANRITKL